MHSCVMVDDWVYHLRKVDVVDLKGLKGWELVYGTIVREHVITIDNSS